MSENDLLHLFTSLPGLKKGGSRRGSVEEWWTRVFGGQEWCLFWHMNSITGVALGVLPCPTKGIWHLHVQFLQFHSYIDFSKIQVMVLFFNYSTEQIHLMVLKGISACCMKRNNLEYLKKQTKPFFLYHFWWTKCMMGICFASVHYNILKSNHSRIMQIKWKIE